MRYLPRSTPLHPSITNRPALLTSDSEIPLLNCSHPRPVSVLAHVALSRLPRVQRHQFSAPLFRRTSSPLSDQPALAQKAAVALGSQERKAAPGWAAFMAGGGTCTKGRVDLHLAWKRGKPSTLSRDLAASHAATDARYV
jgi:hypothetical protein